MQIRVWIRNIMPDTVNNKIKLVRCKNNMKKNYDAIERKVDKLYYKNTGKHIDWQNPKSYTEKINVSKVYCVDEKKKCLSDKEWVRAWVKEKIGEDYLVPIIGVYSSFDEIDFENLPEQFVIKCNHDSGSVTIVKNKSKLTPKEIKSIRKRYNNFYLKRNYAYVFFEMHYEKIQPKIIIEKYMGENVKDYKFLCFNGKPYYCWVDFDRFTNHKRNMYDLEWNLQSFNQGTYGNYLKPVDKPKRLEEMKTLASYLCKGFEHVRVDFYNIDGKTYFGEMTFTNGNGGEVIKPDEWDYKLGDMWKFDKNARNGVRKMSKRTLEN